MKVMIDIILAYVVHEPTSMQLIRYADIKYPTNTNRYNGFIP